jgi:ABC-type transport system involved in cytochrome bd biosynthesis fused ATPase/permease subunit
MDYGNVVQEICIPLSIGDPVVVENGAFVWEPEMDCLQNINLRVKDGQLVAIVGAVGSGKSSLLSAILGEMIKVSGKVKRKVTYIRDYGNQKITG